MIGPMKFEEGLGHESMSEAKKVPFQAIIISIEAVSLPEYFSAALSFLSLLENSLGRSKPATRLMQAH